MTFHIRSSSDVEVWSRVVGETVKQRTVRELAGEIAFEPVSLYGLVMRFR